MERFYDGDQDKLFSEARVVNPFKKLNIGNRIKVPTKSMVGTEECEICFVILPSSVRIKPFYN